MTSRRLHQTVRLFTCVVAVLGCVLLLASCTNDGTPAAAAQDQPSTAAPTAAPATPAATPTPAPTATPVPTPTPVPDPQGQDGTWNLIFHDNFDSFSTDVWEPGWFTTGGYSPSVNGNGAACFHPDQLQAVDGNLVFSIAEVNDDGCRLKDGAQADYVAGLVNTRESFTFSYGYAEARMFLPSDGGPLHNWPAFWHTGSDWPLTGEIDIAEGLTGGVLCSVYHHQGADGEPTQERGCAEGDDPGGWHVFGADWQRDSIDFYYDGKLIFSTTDGVVGSPHYLVFDYTVRNDGSAIVPSEMLVDYVRVWQRDG